VAHRDKTLQRVLSGSSDANIGFLDLRNLLLALGFRNVPVEAIMSFENKGLRR